MSDPDAEFSKLLERFSGLGKPDRKAVLESFSAEDRIAFESAVEAFEKEQAAEEERRRQADRQYLGYSPWLATLVESSVSETATSLTSETQKAIAGEHKALLASQDQGSEDLFADLWARTKSFFSIEPVKPS